VSNFALPEGKAHIFANAFSCPAKGRIASEYSNGRSPNRVLSRNIYCAMLLYTISFVYPQRVRTHVFCEERTGLPGRGHRVDITLPLL
jgi:hypothetical protein